MPWSPHVKQMKHLKKLQLSYCSLKDEDMKHIAVSLSDMPTLVELDLSGNKALSWLCNIMVSSFEANETPSEAPLEMIAH